MEKGPGSACGSHRTEENGKYGFSMVPYREQGLRHRCWGNIKMDFKEIRW